MAVVDVPSTFIQVNMDELVHVCLTAEMVHCCWKMTLRCMKNMPYMKWVKWLHTWSFSKLYTEQ